MQRTNASCSSQLGATSAVSLKTTDAFPALPYPRVTRPSSVDYYIDGDGQGHLFWVGGDPMTSFASQSVYTSFVNGTGVQKLLDSEKGNFVFNPSRNIQVHVRVHVSLFLNGVR